MAVLLLFTLVIPALALVVPRRAAAAARVGGSYFFEETHVSEPENNFDLLVGGMNVNITAPVRKVRLAFNIPLAFSYTSVEHRWDLAPIGNLSTDIRGEMYDLNLQYGRFLSIDNTSNQLTQAAAPGARPPLEITDTTASGARLSITPPDLPNYFANYLRTETTTRSAHSVNDTVSANIDYRYKWMNVRAGYGLQKSSSDTGETVRSTIPLSLGLNGSYEILPATTVSGSYLYTLFSSSTPAEKRTTSGNTFAFNADSAPLDWLGLGANVSENFQKTETSSSTDALRSTTGSRQVFATLRPAGNFQVQTAAGETSFEQASTPRTVSFRSIAASDREYVQEKIAVGVNASRSWESDPTQGRNIADGLGLDSTMDVTPMISLRAGVNVNRNESTSFIATKLFDAEGQLADRALYDDRPAGFIFFDNVHNDLYTKNSSTPGDWSQPAHFERVTRQFSVGKTVQLNMLPTEKTTLSLAYASQTSADRLDLSGTGNRIVNLSLSYSANRRANYSLSAAAALPESGASGYFGAANMSYLFYKGHRMNLNFGTSSFSGKTSETFTGSFMFSLRKQATLDIIYSAAEFFHASQRSVARIRFSKSF